MRLLRAEMLKIRRRWASYIVLGLLLGLMALVFLLIGVAAAGTRGQAQDAIAQTLSFPTAYGLLSQFIFGLGGLLAVCYAAAIGGADWNWGVFRVIVARGESRVRYVVVKYVAVAVALVIGTVVALVVGVLLIFMAAGMAGGSAGDPFGSGLDDLGAFFGLGLPVLLQRAAIGYAVAMLLRSQLAGVVVGIALFFGEGILTAILVVILFAGSFGDGGISVPAGNQWYQFLPFSIGDSVLAAAPGGAGPGGAGGDGGGGGFDITPVPVQLALLVTFIYLGAALLITALYARRTQITS